MITVGQLLENYKKGNIILVDSTTDTEAGVIPAESPVIKLIEENSNRLGIKIIKTCIQCQMKCLIEWLNSQRFQSLCLTNWL